MNRRALLRLCALAAAQGFTPPALAQNSGVQVTPVIVVVPATRNLTSLRVHNWRRREAAFELALFRWSQQGTQNLLTQASEIVATPSTFLLPPGEEQILRVAIAPDARDQGREQTYRLILRELPTPARDERGLRVLVQMSLPIFFQPQTIATRMRAARASSGVVLSNAGNAHVRLREAHAEPGGETLAQDAQYLLAGSSISCPAPPTIQAVELSYVAADAFAPTLERLDLEALGLSVR